MEKAERATDMAAAKLKANDPMRVSLHHIMVFCSFVSLLLYPSASMGDGQNDEPRNRFALQWENDLFAGHDREYTNGFRLTWATSPARGQDGPGLPDWQRFIFDRLPFKGHKRLRRAVSLSMGQMMFTPSDTASEDLLINQRPYAGYLYGALGLHIRRNNRKDLWEVDLGVVGPASLAEQVQDLLHDLTGSEPVNGWRHQLKNEPAIEIIFERRWRLPTAGGAPGFDWDFIPHIGFRAGNVAIYADTGAQFRLGWGLPDDFGNCLIRPGCQADAVSAYPPPRSSAPSRFKFHFFTGMEGRAVLRDIFLDGNTFSDSHSVAKKPFVADINAGLKCQYDRFQFAYAYNYRTKEYETQPDTHVFGSIWFSFAY